jgi:hypothetical protein
LHDDRPSRMLPGGQAGTRQGERAESREFLFPFIYHPAKELTPYLPK